MGRHHAPGALHEELHHEHTHDDNREVVRRYPEWCAKVSSRRTSTTPRSSPLYRERIRARGGAACTKNCIMNTPMMTTGRLCADIQSGARRYPHAGHLRPHAQVRSIANEFVLEAGRPARRTAS